MDTDRDPWILWMYIFPDYDLIIDEFYFFGIIWHWCKAKTMLLHYSAVWLRFWTSVIEEFVEVTYWYLLNNLLKESTQLLQVRIHKLFKPVVMPLWDAEAWPYSWLYLIIYCYFTSFSSDIILVELCFVPHMCCIVCIVPLCTVRWELRFAWVVHFSWCVWTGPVTATDGTDTCSCCPLALPSDITGRCVLQPIPWALEEA